MEYFIRIIMSEDNELFVYGYTNKTEMIEEVM